MTKRALSILSSALGIALASSAALAEEAYPTRPITFVVQYGAGSSTDITARIVADHVSKELGQSVVVENRAGASSMLAGEYVQSKDADGYTVLFAAAGTFETIANFTNSPYAPEKWKPITLVMKTPYILGVQADLPIHNVEEFKQYAASQSAPLNAGVLGNLTGVTGVYTQAVEKETGVDLNKIIYKSGSDVSNDVLAGRLQVAIGSTTMYNDIYHSGAMRFIGTFTPEAIPSLNGVATLDSQGVPLEVEAWLGMFAKAGTPDNVVETLAAAVHSATESDKFKELAERYSSTVSGGTPQDLHDFAYTKSYLGWLEKAKSLGITIEAK